MPGPAKAIAAYDVPERIARYDLDMDVMHPNRHPMADVICRVLPLIARNGSGYSTSASARGS